MHGWPIGSAPLPRTPLVEGIGETYRRFVALRERGKLDLGDLG